MHRRPPRASGNPRPEDEMLDRPIRLVRRLWVTLVLALAALALSAVTAQANDYPVRPITVVIPYAEGGPTDKVARPLVREMARVLGVEIRLAYRGGEGGTKGPTELLREGGDGGYRLLLHNIGMASAPSLYRQLRFDPLGDFEPIGLVGEAPMMLLGRRGLGLEQGGGLGSFVRSGASSLVMAYGGPGGAGQLCGLMLEAALRVRLMWVPYTGTGPALDDLQRGRVDLLCDQTTHALRALESGNARAYALTTRDRLALLPDVPTTAEIGLASVQISVWHGLYAVRGTPPAVITRLGGALAQAVTAPGYLAAMAQAGVRPSSVDQATPQALRTHLTQGIARWRPLIVRAGQYAD
jgi:tripartite-type tricarboxylate transporter receptor subunit TctC